MPVGAEGLLAEPVATVRGSRGDRSLANGAYQATLRPCLQANEFSIEHSSTILPRSSVG